jgi:dTDP-4-dehydrorhamnose 3,5-epimerase
VPEPPHRMMGWSDYFAHGFLTLEPDSEVHYMVSAPYTPEAERGLRFDDPAIGIDWPIPVRVVSKKDRAWADFAG